MSTPLTDQAEFLDLVQQGVQKPLFGLTVDQARAELAEHGVIEAGIGQFQTQAYFQSMRPRTASAAWRSDKPSTNWRTEAKANRAGNPQAGRAWETDR